VSSRNHRPPPRQCQQIERDSLIEALLGTIILVIVSPLATLPPRLDDLANN
jgi:hypothetical protein